MRILTGVLCFSLFSTQSRLNRVTAKYIKLAQLDGYSVSESNLSIASIQQLKNNNNNNNRKRQIFQICLFIQFIWFCLEWE